MENILFHKKFRESLKALSSTEQDSVTSLIGLLRSNQITPGMRPHAVGTFLSFSPNMDLRMLSKKHGNSLTLVYVNHHEAAYRWARQTSILLTEGSEVEFVDSEHINQSLKVDDQGYPLPIPIKDLIEINDDELFLKAIFDISPEWQEWLLETRGSISSVPPPVNSSLVYSPEGDEDLERALKYEVLDWRLFLHPTQKSAVTDNVHKIIGITGGPGTGKTVTLLNRLIFNDRKKEDEGCSVLLAYSVALADNLYSNIKHIRQKHFYVLPLYFLGGEEPQQPHLPTSLHTKIKLSVENGNVYVRYPNGEKRHVRELLIDEAQDLPEAVTNQLTAIIASRGTRLLLAADLDQTIYRANQSIIKWLLDECDYIYNLTYSYRSTRQILLKAEQWVDLQDKFKTSNSAFGLSGPNVKFIKCNDISQQVNVCLEIFRELDRRYKPKETALIYGQYYLPHFKKVSDEEQLIKRYPEIGCRFKFANITKGKEYFAGVIFVSNSYMRKKLSEDEMRLRVNILYVALTRFRDEVSVVYASGCEIEPMLDALAK